MFKSDIIMYKFLLTMFLTIRQQHLNFLGLTIKNQQLSHLLCWIQASSKLSILGLSTITHFLLAKPGEKKSSNKLLSVEVTTAV